MRSLARLAMLVAATALASPLTRAAETLPLKIAVFEFELENTSPTGASWGETSSDSQTMRTITNQARKDLVQSGHYVLVDTANVDASAVRERALRTCHGCDADIALGLGAQRSLIGVVSRAGSTEYYVAVRVTDTAKHEVVYQKMSFFIGGEDAWPTGVHELIDQVLARADR